MKKLINIYLINDEYGCNNYGSSAYTDSEIKINFFQIIKHNKNEKNKKEIKPIILKFLIWWILFHVIIISFTISLWACCIVKNAKEAELKEKE